MSALASRLQNGVSWAGLVTGPAAWGLDTQINYALAGWVCSHHPSPVPWIAVVLALMSLGGGYLSWRNWQAGGGPSRSSRFVAGMGALIALLFALVILMQGSAGLVFQGCER
jgi:hypothetical protein